MDWDKLIDGLIEALPIIATSVGHPEIGVLVQQLIKKTESEIERRMADNDWTRAETLADADATYARLTEKIAAAKKLGHENDNP